MPEQLRERRRDHGGRRRGSSPTTPPLLPLLSPSLGGDRLLQGRSSVGILARDAEQVALDVDGEAAAQRLDPFLDGAPAGRKPVAGIRKVAKTACEDQAEKCQDGEDER